MDGFIAKDNLKKYVLNDYYQFKAKELLLKIEEGRLFMVKHKPSIGFYGENILRVFLRNSLPKGCSVTQGFVYKDNMISRQCDIIIYDSLHYAPVVSFGDIEVIPAESVLSVIEVKTSISHESFKTTLNSFKQLGCLGVLNKFVFIYDSVFPKTLERYFYDKPIKDKESTFIIGDSGKYDHGDIENLPNAICSIRPSYYMTKDYVVQDNRDCVGFNVYQYKYGNEDNKQVIHSLQLFIGQILESCSMDNLRVCNDYSTLNSQEENTEWEILEILYSFGLWDM